MPDKWAVVAQGCDCNATVVVSIPTRGNELLFINIVISSLWHQAKSPALRFATQHTMPRKSDGMWGPECLSTRFPLPRVGRLCVGCSVELIKFFNNNISRKTLGYCK